MGTYKGFTSSKSVNTVYFEKKYVVLGIFLLDTKHDLQVFKYLSYFLTVSSWEFSNKSCEG